MGVMAVLILTVCAFVPTPEVRVMVFVGITVRDTAWVTVQLSALVRVIVPEYVPPGVPAGTTIVFRVPPPAAKAYPVLPWLAIPVHAML